MDFANIGFSGIFNDICSVSILINVAWFDNDKCRLFWAILNSASSHIVGFSMVPGSTVQVDVKNFVKVTPYYNCNNVSKTQIQISRQNLKEGHCTLFFCHSHSHSRSHKDIGNVYLLFRSKATGKTLHKAL